MADNSMRILLFSTAFKPMVGGSEIAIEQITRRMPNVFFDILTPLHNNSWPRQECGENYCIWRLGLGFKGDKFIFPLLGLIKALSLFRVFKYKIIHAYQASHAAGAAFLFKSLHPKIVFLLTLQEGGELDKQNVFIKFFRSLIVKKADRATVISAYLDEYIKKLRPDIQTDLIPNGVDYDLFSQKINDAELDQLRKSLGMEPIQKVIITVSRLVYKNGLTKLINALVMLNVYLRAKLIIVGDGPLKSDLVILARSKNVEDQIIFTGSVDYESLPKYLALADVFVRPSLSEGLGNAFLEAMAQGIPVVGSPRGGILDFLKSEETGLLANPDDPHDIAEKIKIILTDPILAQHLKENGQALIKNQYDWSIIADKMKAVYNSLIAV